jgi:hypothetical protein
MIIGMARSVGRMELFARLGRITVAEAMVDDAFEYGADLAWRSSHLDSPHGDSWFSSMHVSSFPVNDPRACERKLAYGMMAFPSAEPMPQKPIAAGVVGSALTGACSRPGPAPRTRSGSRTPTTGSPARPT